MSVMQSYKIHFIRHGMTEANQSGRYIGRTDLPLSGQGVAELKEFQKHFLYPTVQKVYTSPLARCVQTANLLFPNSWQQEIEDLREYDFGEFEGKTLSELKNNPKFLLFMEGSINPADFGGEDNSEFLVRCDRALATIFDDMMKNGLTECAAITHGGIISTILAAHGVPKRSAQEWGCGCGCGFTVYLTPQMWMRDGSIEVASYVPVTYDPMEYHRSYDVVDVEEPSDES